MRDWFAQAFGRAADAIGDAIGDARDKVVLEGWFGRKSLEHSSADDLGWFRDDPAAPSGQAEKRALEQFYDGLSPTERTAFSSKSPKQDLGIDR